MGLAANQARFLTLTARMHDLENRVMGLSAEKMIYSMQSMDAAQKYNSDMSTAEATPGVQVEIGKTPIQKTRTTNNDVTVTGRYLRENGYVITSASHDETPPSGGGSSVYKKTYAGYNNLPTTSAAINSAGLAPADIVLVQTDSTHSNKASYYQLTLDQQVTGSTNAENPMYNNIPETAGDWIGILIDMNYLQNTTPTMVYCDYDENNCNVYDIKFPAAKDIVDERTGRVCYKEGDLVSLHDLASTIGMACDYTSIATKLNLIKDQYRAFFNIPQYVTTPTYTDVYEWEYYGEASIDSEEPNNNGGGTGTTYTTAMIDNMTADQIAALIQSGDLVLVSGPTTELPRTYKEESTEYYFEYESIYGTDYSARDTAIAAAKADYDKATAEISKREKILDLKMTQANTELSACNKEYDSVKSLIENNIEKGFKLFS